MDCWNVPVYETYRTLIRYGLVCAMLFSGFLTSPKFVYGVEIDDLFDRFDVPWLNRDRSEQAGNEDEPLETDRDSFTPATTTVGAGRNIFESSYSFIQNRTTANNNSFPEIINRFGITDRLEFRLGWNYEVGGGGDVSNGDAGGQLEEPGLKRESQLLYGFKFSLTEQDAWIPQTACIVQATTPTSGATNFSDFQLGYVFGWKLLNNWQLDSSMRYISTEEEHDHFNQWAPSVVLKVPLYERWYVHAEYFGIFTTALANNTNGQYFSPGVHYLINKNCEIGIRVGWGLNQDAANFFSNVGLGLRF